MALSWSVVGAVLFAALLHASWNALVKSSEDKSLDTALIHLIGSFISIPLLAWVGLPPQAAWPFIGASLLIHIAYYITLTAAYHHGDLGLTYPVMRGLGPIFVALFSSLLLGEPLSGLAWFGVLTVCVGVLLLGLSPRSLQQPKAIRFALANAIVIACYTLVDALGVRTTVDAGGSAVQYVAMLFAFDGWAFAMFVLHRRGVSVAWSYARARLALASCGALASLSAYGIALWAMTQAPVAVIAALRETSVLFAALLGTWFLNEALSMRRVLATLMILMGVSALRLA